MSSERSTPLQALLRHRPLTAVTAVLAVAAALGLGLLRPTVYTAEARLAVGGNAGLAAEAVPGYALASQQLAANYARYVNNAQGTGPLETQLGIRPGAVTQVAASPIPESNVVRVEVTARDAGTAQQVADAVADSLRQQVNDTSRTTSAAEDTLAQYTDISGQVAVAQQAADATKSAVDRAQGQPAVGADLAQLTQQAADAAAHLAILRVQQDALGQKYRNQVSSLSAGAANLTSVQSAVVTGDDRVARLGQFGLGGLVVGGVLALLAAVSLERRRERRRARRDLPVATATLNGEAGHGDVEDPEWLPAARGATGPAVRSAEAVR